MIYSDKEAHCHRSRLVNYRGNILVKTKHVLWWFISKKKDLSAVVLHTAVSRETFYTFSGDIASCHSDNISSIIWSSSAAIISCSWGPDRPYSLTRTLQFCFGCWNSTTNGDRISLRVSLRFVWFLIILWLMLLGRGLPGIFSAGIEGTGCPVSWE